MQAILGIASQLLQEGWSMREDLSQTAAATVHHLRKRSSQTQASDQKTATKHPQATLRKPRHAGSGTEYTLAFSYLPLAQER